MNSIFKIKQLFVFSMWKLTLGYGIVIVQVGVVKTYVAMKEVQEKKKDRMKLSLPPKLVEKLVWVVINLFCRLK